MPKHVEERKFEIQWEKLRHKSVLQTLVTFTKCLLKFSNARLKSLKLSLKLGHCVGNPEPDRTTLVSFEQLEKLKRRSADTTFKVSTLHLNTVDQSENGDTIKSTMNVTFTITDYKNPFAFGQIKHLPFLIL